LAPSQTGRDRMRRDLMLATLAAALALPSVASAQENKKASMAVADFSYTARAGVAVTTRTHDRSTTIVVPDLGVELETSTLTQKLVTALVKTGKFDVVERAKLDDLMKEQTFGATGMVDASRAAQMGKVLGADYFLEGVINIFMATEAWTEN